MGTTRHAWSRASHRRPREGSRHRERQLRAAEPRADGAPARAEDRRHDPRDPAHRGLRAGGPGPSPGRAGKDGWAEPADPHRTPGPGPTFGPPAPATPESAAGRSRRDPRPRAPRPRPRDQPGTAGTGAPGRVSRTRRRLSEDPGTPVQGERAHGPEPQTPGRRRGSGGAVVSSTPLSRKDFVSDQDVRWCPGCGDYAILAQVQKLLPDLGVPRENFVFISGIGCSSRFPYYVNTYGFHSIHGRAPAIATGLKVSRPELSVWVVTGDGDALSIGGNHLIHVLRRNVDLNILLFNNRIYGLTKGQYSPTSEPGKVTKSTPFGSVDRPFDPLALALGAGASFVARSVDVEAKHLTEVLRRAHAHRGAAFVEVLQNCNVFNDGAFDDLTDKTRKADSTLLLEHGKPFVFGRNRNRGIRLRGLVPEVVELGNGITEADLVVHDEHDSTMAALLSRVGPPDFPTPIGILRAVDRPTYEDGANAQIAAARERSPADLGSLLRRGETWVVR